MTELNYSQKLWITLWMNAEYECAKPIVIGIPLWRTKNAHKKHPIKSMRYCKLLFDGGVDWHASPEIIGIVSNSMIVNMPFGLFLKKYFEKF
jgi:hypothetical protein